VTETAQQIVDRLDGAMLEMRFLLERGYGRAHVLRFVGEHHQLPEQDRNVLERVVFASAEAASRRARLVSESDLRGEAVVVDGHNVLIGLQCLEAGAPVFLCDDGVVRDVAGRRGLQGPEERTVRLLRKICELFASHAVTRVDFVFDQPVSRSGELAALCRTVAGEISLVGDCRTEVRADRAVIDAAATAVACSSDRVILDASPRVFDVIRALAGDPAVLGRSCGNRS